MSRLLSTSLLCCLMIMGCVDSSKNKDSGVNRRATPVGDVEKTSLELETIQISGQGDLVRVEVKITNITDKTIHNAQATCILNDAKNQPITFKKHYVVRSHEGGLAPKAVTFFTYVFDADISVVKSVSYHTESVKFE